MHTLLTQPTSKQKTTELSHCLGHEEQTMARLVISHPTDNQVNVPMCEVVQFNEEGQLIAREQYFDRMTFLEQLAIWRKW